MSGTVADSGPMIRSELSKRSWIGKCNLGVLWGGAEMGMERKWRRWSGEHERKTTWTRRQHAKRRGAGFNIYYSWSGVCPACVLRDQAIAAYLGVITTSQGSISHNVPIRGQHSTYSPLALDIPLIEHAFRGTGLATISPPFGISPRRASYRGSNSNLIWLHRSMTCIRVS
jgi:hypothetical protein